MTVSVVIPHRDRGDHEHVDALAWVAAQLHRQLPEWEVIVCDDGRTGDAAWSISTARNRGVVQASGDVIVLLDTDMWVQPEKLRQAAKLVQARECVWVQPHEQLLFLSRKQTLAYQAAGRARYETRIKRADRRRFQFPPYKTIPGDAPVVVAREFYETLPQDPRFECYSPEAICWGDAIELLHPDVHAARVTLPGNAVHFFHKTAPRAVPALMLGPVPPGSEGTDDSPEMRGAWALARRYAWAYTHYHRGDRARGRAEMRAIVREYLS